MFQLEEKIDNTVIKVVGVGGAGGNAVRHMIDRGVPGVEFVCANTDAQVLPKTGAGCLIQLGDSGLGAGSNPVIGREAADGARHDIAEALQGAHLVFITAGMGGGTGTGAGPIIAEVARDLGILTVGVVSKPFDFEGPKRQKVAEEGITALSKHVDSLIVVLNEKLAEVLGDDITQKEAFSAADDVLHNAVSGIAEIINNPGLINVDFQDVRTVMSEQGRAMMGSAVASGPDRARQAAEQAIACPLLEGVNLSGARGLLVNITASADSLKLREPREVMSIISAYAAPDATVKYGAVYDDSMGENLRVTVIVTGLGNAKAIISHQNMPLQIIKTGTDNTPTHHADYTNLDMPAVLRRGHRATYDALQQSGMDKLDIPAFLRKQAD